MIRSLILVGGACLLSASPALADAPLNTLTNPSFENADPDFPSEPEGFAGINIGSPGWNSDFARTGMMSLALGPSSSGPFTGWTTDLFAPSGDLYNPPYEFRGGDLYVSGWYLINDDDALGPTGGFGVPLDNVGIKLEFRRVPPNFSIYQEFELPLIDVATTGGQWVFFEHVFEDANISDEFPPFPGSVTILPFRFDIGNGQQGTIYWDDLCVYQIPAATCACDVQGDGDLDPDDINAFVVNFTDGVAGNADIDGDGDEDPDDIAAFVTCFTNPPSPDCDF